MNMKSYAFRLAIAVIAFVLGISAQGTLREMGQFSTLNWITPRVERGNIASDNFTGAYYLSEENFPSGFTDFDHLELGTPTGIVYTDRPYTIRTIASGPGSLVFETEVNGGISYRFVGRVRRSGDLDESSHESRAGDIIGRLEKLKNGRTIATLETTFYLFGR